MALSGSMECSGSACELRSGARFRSNGQYRSAADNVRTFLFAKASELIRAQCRCDGEAKEGGGSFGGRLAFR